VGTALDSVLAQTYRNIEVIVVDDGSTDDTPRVLAPYADRVTVISKANGGPSTASNRAFQSARGSLIKFFDADDIMGAELIERQVLRLGSRRDAVAIGEWSRFVGEEPRAASPGKLPRHRDADPVDWLCKTWMNALPMMQCALYLIPRDVLLRSGLWDVRLSLLNDFEFFARVLLSAKEIIHTPGAHLFYRSGIAGTVSGRKSRTAVESAFLSVSLGTQHLLAAADSPQARRACANVLQNFEYEYYPEHPDLRASARRRAAELGGADIAPVGPPRFHMLRRLVGWRVARRVQLAMGR
jgi:glycosyltransferase involved in cell wall biosynthesis